MGKMITCPLCEKKDAWEWPVSGQDKYEIRCDKCTIFQLTAGQDQEFIDLPKEDREALSDYVRERFGKTKVATHLDSVEKFSTIINKYKGKDTKD